MGDVICRRCGEPWDYYGARHGDMTKEEYEDMMKGKGCPCCVGKEVEKVDRTLEFLRSVDSGTDEDPLKYL